MNAPETQITRRTRHPLSHLRRRVMRIGLVVDHPLRDLDGMCLVAQKLTEQGHEAVLMPFYTQHLDLPHLGAEGLALDMIVLNYVRPANRAVVDAAAAQGIALAVLDTEGGLLNKTGPTSPDGMAQFLRESGLDERLSLYCFWGEYLRDSLVESTALSAARAITTGCPRFDLAQPQYRSGTGASGEVLVNTNFPTVNPVHGGEDEIDDVALRSVGYADNDIAEIAVRVQQLMDRLMEAVRHLAEARPQRQFVVRPHPFERLEPYIRAFADLKNVRVERRGTAMEALLRADCLLHLNCTTAIEAYLTGVPPISLEFIREPASNNAPQLPTTVSHLARSLPEALAMIDRTETLSPGVNTEAMAPFFGPLDGRAADRVVEALLNVEPALQTGPSAMPQKGFKNWAGRMIGSRLIEAARCLIKPSRRIKRFSAQDVRMRVERLASIHGKATAKVELVRTPLGLPIAALRLRPAERS